MTFGKQILYTATAAILGVYFLTAGLVKAKPFLAPLLTAVILALLVLPIARKLESWKIPRMASSLINTLLLFLVSVGFVALISIQIQSFVADWDKAKQKIMPEIEKLEAYVYEKTPLGPEDIEKQQSEATGNMGKQALSFINGVYSFSGDYLLTFIYIFFLLNYRRKFRQFFVKLFKKENKKDVDEVLTQATKITQGYLYGKFILMIFLAVIYALGMAAFGVSNFIIISVLAALLSIIPYIGNIIGFLIAIGLGYIADGDTTALIGIVITFSVAQFIESYLFEPYVVGDNVNLDPFITILAVVAGNMIWGVIGMILSIPVLGIINVIFMHVKPLKPYSFLLGNSDVKQKSKNIGKDK
ncbi:AI-2E family transporter [Flavobacterium beibuense]|uniref:Membrane protein, UPF0118 n=1 Tax=Flavobacterium beibuense TaxID=657326 RepID=A0A444WBL5_9FLAO|nr:AI-2E family transporter [Flavobacterium beibuense]RYJ43199.1 Membrane protein, UPF0118 [Flavobacterium beibuense]